ncbi:hypothetical protein NKG94_32330 [Micromonospora sp. M12]
MPVVTTGPIGAGSGVVGAAPPLPELTRWSAARCSAGCGRAGGPHRACGGTGCGEHRPRSALRSAGRGAGRRVLRSGALASSGSTPTPRLVRPVVRPGGEPPANGIGRSIDGQRGGSGNQRPGPAAVPAVQGCSAGGADLRTTTPMSG